MNRRAFFPRTPIRNGRLIFSLLLLLGLLPIVAVLGWPFFSRLQLTFEPPAPVAENAPNMTVLTHSQHAAINVLVSTKPPLVAPIISWPIPNYFVVSIANPWLSPLASLWWLPVTLRPIARPWTPPVHILPPRA